MEPDDFIKRLVRRRHRSARSASAARAARQAVAVAARRAGRDSEAPEVVVVAKAAGEVARALVAEDRGVESCYFFERWEGLLRLRAWAPCQRRVAA